VPVARPVLLTYSVSRLLTTPESDRGCARPRAQRRSVLRRAGRAGAGARELRLVTAGTHHHGPAGARSSSAVPPV